MLFCRIAVLALFYKMSFEQACSMTLKLLLCERARKPSIHYCAHTTDRTKEKHKTTTDFPLPPACHLCLALVLVVAVDSKFFDETRGITNWHINTNESIDILYMYV